MANNLQIRLSKPFALLKTFSEKELLKFEQLIKSKYLSDNEVLHLLLKSLKRYALPNYDKFTNEARLLVYKAVFKNEKAQNILANKQQKKLNKTMNELLDLAETFLKIEAIIATDEYDIELLLPELSKRNQMPLYEKHKKTINNKLRKEKIRGLKYQRQCYKIEAENARQLFINNKLDKDDNYDELQIHLDTKYLLEKLQYHLAKVTLMNRYENKDFNLKPFNTLTALLKQPSYKNNILIKLYLLNISLIETNKDSIFKELLKQLKEKQAFIPTDFLKPLYTNLTNYCTFQLNKGHLNYYNYLFEIYKVMHAGQLLIMNNTIDIGLLKNIITTACIINTFDWADEILNHYQPFIPKMIRKSIIQYNKGVIAFNQHKYDLALTHFKEVKKIDVTYDLSFRMLQLRCYYETDVEYDPNTANLLKSLQAYIKQQKKLTTQQKESYFNFIMMFNKLYSFKKIRPKRSRKMAMKKAQAELKACLFKFELIREKKWLLHKIVSINKS